MKHDSSKQDLSIASQSSLHLNINPEKTKINLFIAESFKNLQIVEQTYHRSYGCREQTLKEEVLHQAVPQTKRNVSQKSDSYHRVTNSRKIKSKRTAKQHLPRSDYFYFHSLCQQPQQNPINMLMTDYEAFHMMIVNNDFSAIENSVIRLSHYGNKKKGSKSREKSVGLREFNHSQSLYYQGASKDHKQQKKPLSKSAVVPEVDMKRSVVLGCGREEQILEESRQNVTQLNNSKKGSIPQKQVLSKYTTPIRTIFLNTSQQSPHQIQSQSSVNKLSISTPLRNNKPYLYEDSRLSTALKKDKNTEQIYYEGNGIHLNGLISLRKSQTRNLAQSGNKCNGLNLSGNRPKLSLVSSQKKWSMHCQAQNVELAKPNQVYVSKYQSDFIKIAHSNLDVKKNLLQTTGSVLHSNRQSRSRSGSRKGLSLTQSASHIVSKSKSQLACSKAMVKLANNNMERQKQILAKKLDQKGLLSSKRVEIRIY